MFTNSYQNGTYFEVWDSKISSEKTITKQLFKLQPSSLKKYYDKTTKTYLYHLKDNQKISLPGNEHSELGLHSKYLVMHVFVNVGENWGVELGVTDVGNFKRRINITTAYGKQQTKYFSLRYPIDSLQRGSWLFVAINVYSFMEAFKDIIFRSLDHIVVSGSCQLRRVFTMKQWNQWEIPKSFWFPSDVSQEFQLIEYKQQLLPKIRTPHKSLQQSDPVTSLYQKLTPKKISSKLTLVRSEIGSIRQQPSETRFLKKSANRSINLNPITKNSEKRNYGRKKNRLKSVKNEIESAPQTQLKQEKKNVTRASGAKIVLERSFREDEALAGQSESQKAEKLLNKVPIKKQEEWSSEENQPTMKKQELNPPLRTIITKQNKKTVVKVQKNPNEELQLIYDEMAGCYYHPETLTYYEIKS